MDGSDWLINKCEIHIYIYIRWSTLYLLNSSGIGVRDNLANLVFYDSKHRFFPDTGISGHCQKVENKFNGDDMKMQ